MSQTLAGTHTSDIAIIGGGLAGLCAAIQAAKAGFSVALFEKETYPFHRVCGEYISLESWQFLERLGLPLSTLALPQITRLSLSAPNGNTFTQPLPLGGFGISRHRIDHLLSSLATSLGVQLFTNTKVSNVEFNPSARLNKELEGGFAIYTQSLTLPAWESTVVLGSFGKRSNLDLQWKRPFTQHKPNKLNHYIGIKYHIRYPHPADTIALHNFKDGYCGMSKIEEDRSCLCYLTTAENLKKHGTIGQMERAVLYQNPHLRRIFTEAEMLFSEPLAIAQISFETKSTLQNHVLMLGDAAGMITPLCGNGMSMAMHASKLAIELVTNYLTGTISRTTMEIQYDTTWQKHFSNRLSVGRTIQSLFGGTTTSNLLVSACNLFPFLAKPIIKATHGTTF